MPRSDHSAFLTGSPLTRLAWFGLGLVTAALALGCTPQIGDKCTVSTNCSSTGDRLCDVTQPDGYCTKFNCEPGSCPGESVCVNFGVELSPVAGCQSSQRISPYRRSFCMANCSNDGDCRPGYACLAVEEFHAVLAEYSSDGQKVCAVKPKTYPELAQADAATDAGAKPEQSSNEVCIGADAGPSEGGSSSSSAGAGGTSAGASAGSSSVGGGAGTSGTSAGAAGDAGAAG